VPDLSGRELLREWRAITNSLIASATSRAGGSELPRQLLEATQRQLELVQEVIERERKLQKDLTDRFVAPLDAVLELLEASGATLRRQAEALEAAGQALEQTAGLMKGQAELVESTIGILRTPAELARAAAAPRRPAAKSGRAPRR